jgi:hypothetical protein
VKKGTGMLAQILLVFFGLQANGEIIPKFQVSNPCFSSSSPESNPTKLCPFAVTATILLPTSCTSQLTRKSKLRGNYANTIVNIREPQRANGIS